MNKIPVAMLIAICMIPLGNLLVPGAEGGNITVEITRFSNNQPDITVEFVGGGVDTNYGLSLQTGLYIDEARLKLSSVAQPAGSKDYPTNLTVDFGGDKALEWSWIGPGYGSLGRQTLFTNNKPYMNASLPPGGGTNDSVAIRLPKTANIRSATMNVSAGSTIGTPGKLLILYAMYNDYGWADDVVNKMKAFTGDFKQVDSFDAGSNTPTWDDIKDYSMIMTFTDVWYGYMYQDGKAVGDLLADYVDAGGGVVVTMCAFYSWSNYYITGRFYDQGYYAIAPSQQLTTSSSGLGNTLIPGHPVMKNVTSISWPYYGWTYRSYVSSGSTGSKVISTWADGYVCAVEKNVNGVDRVDLNMWPSSYDASGIYGSYPALCYKGDGDDLLKNALLYSGRKPVDAKIDLFNDSNIELDRTGFTGNYTFPDFSASLQSYINNNPATYEDKFGQQFVDVPINVTTLGSGRLMFDKLEVLYDYSTMVDANPANGNLTMALSDLQSSIIGEENNTLTMQVASSSSGKVRFSDLYVRLTPPQHSPRVDSFYPALGTSVHESSTVELGVNATDIYGNPMTYSWTHNGEPVAGAETNRLSLSFGYEDAGVHTVVARIANGITEKTYTDLAWQLTVLNVNRPPVIDSFLPASDVNVNENSSQVFEVTASDPDAGDALSYSWFLDGRRQADAASHDFTYSPGYYDKGARTMKAVVTDGSGATASRTWQVTVVNVNQPPLIQSWKPKEAPRISELESVVFSVVAADPDTEDRLTINWYIDDEQAFVGNPFTYTTDYKSAGTHTIKAVATDGNAQDSHAWSVVVQNVNRAPSPVVDTPVDLSEYMQGQAIRFKATSSSDPDNETLSYSWKEGGVNVSDQPEFERAFAPGLHTLTLEVRDTSGGKSSTTVRFRVRFTDISVVIGLDRLEVQSGSKVTVVLTMSNMGDINATDVPLELLVDGKSIGSSTVKDLRAGGMEKVIYEWKATRGAHTLTAKSGETTWTKEITASAAPAPPPSGGIGDYIWPIIIIVVFVVLVGFGAAVLRRK